MSESARRILDYIAYIAIGLAVVGTAVWFAENEQDLGITKTSAYKWIGSIISTLVLFGYFLNAHRRRLRMPAFWLGLLVLLLVHTAIITVLWRLVPEIKGLWWGILISFEIAVGDSIIRRYAPPVAAGGVITPPDATDIAEP